MAIKEKVLNFYEEAFGENVPTKRHFFNIVCVGAPIFSFLATIANLISHSTVGYKPYGLYVCIICTVTCLALYPLSKFFKNIDLLIAIVAVGMDFLIMPLLYITVGGITSSMPLYFVVALVFTVVMLDNRLQGFLLVFFSFVWYGALFYCDCYNINGFHDTIASFCTLDSSVGGNIYVDTFCDLIVAASCIAVLVKILASKFEKQQAKTDKLLVQMEELAVKDPLTGAYNRRFLIKYLDSGIANAKAQGKNMAIVMFDIDKFKRINDDYGHLVGDEVIKAMAKTLMNSCRDYDIVSRYGGEEFVLVMPGASEETAINRANQIRETFSQLKIAPEIDRPVTVSGGVAEIKPSMKLPEHFISVADDNLYVAKETGRNKIVGTTYNHEEVPAVE